MSELFSCFSPIFHHFGAVFNEIATIFPKFLRVGARSWLFFDEISQLSLATVSELFATPKKSIFLYFGYFSLLFIKIKLYLSRDIENEGAE